MTTPLFEIAQDLLLFESADQHISPTQLVDLLESVAQELLALAEEIRNNPDVSGNDFVSQGGVSDRVLMNVFGPDGHLKQVVDTKDSR